MNFEKREIKKIDNLPQLLDFWEKFKEKLEKNEELEVEMSSSFFHDRSKEKIVLEVDIFKNERDCMVPLITAVFYEDGKAMIRPEGEQFEEGGFCSEEVKDWQTVCEIVTNLFEEFL